ncbi:WD40-repeat-containing domain protein [Catenaria anguillulae PL171]|uniref:WD40-repeat-containing domain protein n=1 Tax=Catenaria anguillulae PL171 TaxID=765915 RepID=A0A1Y2HF18_9FUNG|nr:WD40-repeat-containing domain protein [Catenaria anguillulae PL171]
MDTTSATSSANAAYLSSPSAPPASSAGGHSHASTHHMYHAVQPASHHQHHLPAPSGPAAGSTSAGSHLPLSPTAGPGPVHASEIVMPWPRTPWPGPTACATGPGYGLGLFQWGGSASAGGGGGGVADNKLCIVEHDQRGDAAMIASVAEAPHPYPISKVQWAPASSSSPNLLATSGDYLRIWRFWRQSKADLVAPLTAFDWNETSPNLVVTSSIDTTCTVWDVTTAQAKTQLIAHDREVFDVGFASGTADIFASVGADGSVRLFDLRALEHSTIIYEHPQSAPLLRVAWNRQDPNYLAVVAYESHSIHILDVRVRPWPWPNWQDTPPPTPARKGAGGAAAAVGGSATLGGSAALAASATGSEPAVYAPLLAHAPHPQGAEVENLCISHLADWVAVTAASQVKLLRL